MVQQWEKVEKQKEKENIHGSSFWGQSNYFDKTVFLLVICFITRLCSFCMYFLDQSNFILSYIVVVIIYVPSF